MIYTGLKAAEKSIVLGAKGKIISEDIGIEILWDDNEGITIRFFGAFYDDIDDNTAIEDSIWFITTTATETLLNDLAKFVGGETDG